MSHDNQLTDASDMPVQADSNASAAGDDVQAPRPPAALLTRPWCVCLLAMIACGLWGSAIPFIKIGYGLLGISSSDVASEILFAGIRFMLAGCIALVVCGIARGRMPRLKRTSWGMVARLSLAQTIGQYLFFYIGVSHASGVKGTIINASSTFLCVLVAALLFRSERLSARKIAGCAIGFAGVILVNLGTGELGGSMTLTGEGFILIAALCYAISSSLIHVYAQHDDPVTLSGYQFLVGGAVLALAGAACGGGLSQLTIPAAGVIAWLAFVSGCAYSLWSLLLKYNPTSRVAIYGFMNPVFGVVLSAVLLDEGGTLPVLQCMAALALVAVGIIMVNMPARLFRRL